MDLREIGSDGMDWIDVAEDRDCAISWGDIYLRRDVIHLFSVS
jgi:hypothetical protein